MTLEKFKSLTHYAERDQGSQSNIRICLMLMMLLYQKSVSYEEINNTFEISLSTYKRHIKELREVINLFFGEEAKLLNTKQTKSYILYIPYRPLVLY